MERRRLILLTALAVFIAPPAYPYQADQCRLPKGAKSTISLTDFPPLLQRLNYGLGRRDGPLATDVPQHFNPPMERLLRAFNLGRRWVIVEQAGGFARYLKMVVYALSKKGDLAMLITDHPQQPSCRAIVTALQSGPADY
ncbi:MAG TPA: hypothetical protein VHC39_02940 [Rhizomicrobium sp.]|nr:hypothetical protein [Rhizomicrobium sp.]